MIQFTTILMPALCLSLGLPLHYNSGKGLAQTLANDFEARVIAEGETLSAPTKAAVLALIQTAIADDWWDDVHEIYPFVSTGLNGALVKLKTATGLSSTMTNGGMASGDYSQTAGMGPLALTTKYLSTGFVLSDFSLTTTNFFCSTSLVAKTVAASGYSMGTESADGDGYRADVDNRLNGFSTTGAGGYSTHTLPLVLVTNHGPSQVQIGYHNGAQILNSAQTVVADSLSTSSEFRFFRVKRFDTTYYGAGKVGLTIVGPSLSDAKCWSIARATEAFELAVGRSGFTAPVAALIGDSISSGQASTTPALSMAGLIETALGGRLLNCGRPGMGLSMTGSQATSGYLARATHVALPTDILILALGTNDINADGTANGDPTTIATLKANLIQMLTEYQAAGKTVYVCGACYRKPAVSSFTKCAAYNDAIAEAADNQNYHFIDLDTPIRGSGDPDSYMQDNVHPNDAGMELLANEIIAVMLPPPPP